MGEGALRWLFVAEVAHDVPRVPRAVGWPCTWLLLTTVSVPRLCPHSQETQLWKAREARNAFRLNNLKQQVAAVPFFTEVRHPSSLPSTTFSGQLSGIVCRWESDT